MLLLSSTDYWVWVVRVSVINKSACVLSEVEILYSLNRRSFLLCTQLAGQDHTPMPLPGARLPQTHGLEAALHARHAKSRSTIAAAEAHAELRAMHQQRDDMRRLVREVGSTSGTSIDNEAPDNEAPDNEPTPPRSRRDERSTTRALWTSLTRGWEARHLTLEEVLQELNELLANKEIDVDAWRELLERVHAEGPSRIETWGAGRRRWGAIKKDSPTRLPSHERTPPTSARRRGQPAAAHRASTSAAEAMLAQVEPMRAAVERRVAAEKAAEAKAARVAMLAAETEAMRAEVERLAQLRDRHTRPPIGQWTHSTPCP